MQLLHGTVQHYAWGTTDAIPEILGIPADGRPFAEYWLGAHPLSPSEVDGEKLDAAIAARPWLVGEPSRKAFGDQLPYLLKVLSARHALSLQVHPSRDQAREGYDRENAAGIAMDAPERTYRDDWPKPEILVALDEFHTLSGFRDPKRTASLFEALGVAEELSSVIGPLTERKGSAALAEVFLDVLSLQGERAKLSELVCAAAMRHKDDEGEIGDFARTVLELDEVFPSDPGILAALLMNRVVLQPGEAVFVPAGHMHAHLRGTGIEVMANSDNVIRGGLTNKHVDVGELVKVVDFSSGEPEVTRPEPVSPGVDRYPTPCPEFDVWRITGFAEAGVAVPGEGSARELLMVSGDAELVTGEDRLPLGRGGAAFLAADDVVTLRGDAVAFVAASGLR
ncbi:mannose-6-phosphate isomerase, class I [Propionicimonas sp.]|uniref:mannose-6-phosphate isomerase, class I n=1 Tax=Propionicimonas sp. TaxID=1955623 RepID=UPI0039E483E4